MFIVLLSFVSPLCASDFEWRLSLNLRAQSDPYGYRYGLMHRFGRDESHVMSILNRVYEPADAYMVFRLAELSGFSPEYVLGVYHDRRHYGWHDIASVLGIHSDRHDFIFFREHHDMREVYYDYNYRRKERYEERYYPPVQHHYVPQPKKHYAPAYKHPAPKPQTHVPPHHGGSAMPEQRHKPYHHQEARADVKKSEAPRSRPPQPYNNDGRYDGPKRHHYGVLKNVKADLNDEDRRMCF